MLKSRIRFSTLSPILILVSANIFMIVLMAHSRSFLKPQPDTARLLSQAVTNTRSPSACHEWILSALFHYQILHLIETHPPPSHPLTQTPKLCLQCIPHQPGQALSGELCAICQFRYFMVPVCLDHLFGGCGELKTGAHSPPVSGKNLFVFPPAGHLSQSSVTYSCSVSGAVFRSFQWLCTWRCCK